MTSKELKTLLAEKEQMAIRSDKIKEQLVGQILLLRDQIVLLEKEEKDSKPEKKEEEK